MTMFNLDVTDRRLLSGLTAAREAYNASTMAEDDVVFATDAAYLKARVNDILDSYASQHVDDPINDAFLDRLSADKRTDVEAVLARA